MAEVSDVPEEQRYVLTVDGASWPGRLDYAVEGDVFVARHVGVDPAYEGRGLGSTLVREVLDEVRRRAGGCDPRVRSSSHFLREHPEYADLGTRRREREGWPEWTWLEKVLLVIHLLGFGALVRWRVRAASRRGQGRQHGDAVRRDRPRWSAALLLVGVLEGQDESVNNTKVAVKLAVALVIAVLCWVNRAKDARARRPLQRHPAAHRPQRHHRRHLDLTRPSAAP